MAYNRHIRADEKVYIQSSFLEIDTTVVQLPSDVGPDQRLVTHEDTTERIELSHEQLCRLVAACLLGGFLVFLLGYTAGAQRATRALPAELIPTLYTKHEKVTKHTAGRFATHAEAATLCQELNQKGIATQTQLMVSHSVKGDKRFWYQVTYK